MGPHWRPPTGRTAGQKIGEHPVRAGLGARPPSLPVPASMMAIAGMFLTSAFQRPSRENLRELFASSPGRRTPPASRQQPRRRCRSPGGRAQVPGQTVKDPPHRTGSAQRSSDNRSPAVKQCRRYWGAGYSHGGTRDCDEYPFASTYEGAAEHDCIPGPRDHGRGGDHGDGCLRTPAGGGGPSPCNKAGNYRSPIALHRCNTDYVAIAPPDHRANWPNVRLRAASEAPIEPSR
ncbi:NucA/NucB deoxyribonuclease domain-containing protein [Streptomyces sp. NPDC001675]